MRTHQPFVFLLAVAAVAGAALPVAAQTKKKPAKPAAVTPPSRAQALTQVDGITNRVVDKLWETTDHYWHDGDYNRIVALVRVCVEADPSFAEAYSSGAWLLWSMGDTPAADAMLEQGLKNNPKSWDMPYELGWHLYNTRRYKEALPFLQASVKYSNAPAQPWKVLAHCYDRLGRWGESAATWKAVVEKFPKDVAGPPNLQRVLNKQRTQTQEL